MCIFRSPYKLVEGRRGVIKRMRANGNGVAVEEAMVKDVHRIAADGQTWSGKDPWGAADKFPPPYH